MNYLFLFGAFFLLPLRLIACPELHGVPDWNCDGKIKIVVIGDSLVYGIGDTANNNQGGYVLRVAGALKGLEIKNQGVPGLNTRALIKRLTSTSSSENVTALKEDLLGADVVVLDLGRNDRWFFGTPLATFRNLKRISKSVATDAVKNTGLAPVVITANLMLPNRGSQGPWVKELNKYILRSNSLESPADLRFDLVSKRLISKDQIHPTSKGYNALAKVLTKYITRALPLKLRKLQA